MEQKKPLDAEETLEKIFYYMNQLIDEKEFSATIRILTDMGRTVVNSDRASFWYWDTQKKQYWTLAALDSERIIVPEGTGIVGASIQNNETIVLNAPYTDDRFNPEVDKASGYTTRSILCMPVTNARGQVIGAYQALNKLGEDENAAFDERDVKRLALAAVYCGKTLESQLLYRESQVDALTGLRNRRGFYEYYTDYIRPESETKTVSVIMCDIDFFKKVNDTYGHNAGDAVLEHVAGILREGIKDLGRAVRWGGEEFVLLLPGLDLAQAGQLAEDLRRRAADCPCHCEEGQISITMSFGVKEWEKDLSADENISKVDSLLYRAKETGRNKVISDT